MAKDMELFKEIHEIANDEELNNSSSLQLAIYYQFKGKLSARNLDKEGALENYKKSEQIYLKHFGGKRHVIM